MYDHKVGNQLYVEMAVYYDISIYNENSLSPKGTSKQTNKYRAVDGPLHGIVQGSPLR